MPVALDEQELSSDPNQTIAEAYGALRSTGAQLVGPDGHSRELPQSFYNFLVRLIGDLAAKRSVAIIHAESTFTTVQAFAIRKREIRPGMPRFPTLPR
jgi:hypothetical protein